MHPAPTPPQPDRTVELRVPLATILKVVACAGVLWALWMLRPFLGLMVIAVLAAVTLAPAVEWLQRRKLPHSAAVAVVGLGLVVAIAGFWAIVLPPLSHQISTFMDHAKTLRGELDAKTQAIPLLHAGYVEALAWPHSPEARELFKHKWTWGLAIVDGLTAAVLLIIVTLYLLLDGKRLFAWLVGYVPRKHRARVAATVPEVEAVVRAYVRGQVITSVLCGIYSFGALTLLHVPGAIPLAIVAAVLDVLPVLGFILAVVPASLLALTNSPAAALGTLGAYVLYHLIENYLLIPKIYGKQLRLSTLAVLVAIVVGGTLGGVLGAVLVLPFVAAYPIIERRWLGGYLGTETIQDHAALDAPDVKVAAEAADQVLEGQQPPVTESPDHRH